MPEDLLIINSSITVDEGSNTEDDDLTSEQITALAARIAAAPAGSVLDYFDSTYVSGGASLGLPTNIAESNDMVSTPEGADAIAWTDVDGDNLSGELSNLLALNTTTSTYDPVTLTTDPTNSQILVGTYSGGTAFVAVLVESDTTPNHYDVLIFLYAPAIYQSDTTDPDDVVTLANVYISVESDISIGDFSQAQAGANEHVQVGDPGDDVQLVFTGDRDWVATGGNTPNNTSATEMAAGEQGTDVGNSVVVDLVYNTDLPDEQFDTEYTHDASKMDLGEGHVDTTEFTWTLVNVNGGPGNRVDVTTEVQWADRSMQGALTDAEFYEQSLAGGLGTQMPEIIRVEVYASDPDGLAPDVLVAYLDKGGSIVYPPGDGDNAVGITISGNTADVDNLVEDYRVKVFTADDDPMNRIITTHDSDLYDFVGDTTEKGSLSNKKVDFGQYTIGGIGDETEAASLNFGDDGPSDDGGTFPIPVFEDGLTPFGLTDDDGELDGDGDVEGTSVIFDLDDLPIPLVDAGADFPASWGLVSDPTLKAAAILALEAQSMSSGGVGLSFTINNDVNADGDDVLLASAGATPVFRLTVGEDGGSLLELLSTFDTYPGSDVEAVHDEDEFIADLGMVLVAYDLEGDPTYFDDADLQMVAEDDAPEIDALGSFPTAQVDESYLNVDATGINFAAGFNSAYGADGAATTNPLTFHLQLGDLAGGSGLVDSKSGLDVVLAVEAATGDIVGTVTIGSDVEEVVRVSMTSAGVLTLDQSRAVIHEPNLGPNDVTTFGAGAIEMVGVVRDFEVDSATAEKDISGLLELVDDNPSFGAQSAAPTLEVDESFLATDDSESFASVFDPIPGNDGQKSLVYSLALGGGGSGLTDSQTGDPVLLKLDGGDIVGYVVIASVEEEVVRVSVDEFGNVTLDQSRAVMHLPNVGPNDVTYFGTNAVRLYATLKDNDNDEAVDWVDISPNLKLVDDAPSFGPNGTVPTLSVDESDLATDASSSFAGVFDPQPGNDGQKSYAYSLELGAPVGGSGLADSQTGDPVLLKLDGGDVVGYVVIASVETEVVRVSVNGSGEVELDQSRAVLHLPNVDGNDVTSFNANSILLAATLIDNDNDDAKDTVDISGNLQMYDDTPSAFSPGSLFVFNDATGYDDAALDSYGNMGNDLDGTAVFVNGSDGDSFTDFVSDAGSVGGLDALYFFGFGTDELILTTNSSGPSDDMSDWVMRMTLSPDNDVVANDLVSLEMFARINALVNVPIDTSTAEEVQPGNPDVLLIPDLGDSTIDVQLSGFEDGPGGTTPTTVNIKSGAVGVGNGQDFDVAGDVIDRLSLEFYDELDAIRGQTAGDDLITVNNLVFEVNQNNKPKDDADLILRAYNDAGVEVQITEISINGVSLVSGGIANPAGVPSNDTNDTIEGPITATSAGFGWDLDGVGGGTAGSSTDNDVILVGTEFGFQRLDIIADGRDNPKDTFDILLQTVSIPEPNDIDFSVDARLIDEDFDTSPYSTIDVTLDYDGIA